MKFREQNGGENIWQGNNRIGRKLRSNFHFSLSRIKAIKSRTARRVWHVERWKVRMECQVVVATLEGKSPSEKSVPKW